MIDIRPASSGHRRRQRRSALWPLIALVVVACSSATPSPTPSAAVSPATDDEWQPTTAWEKTLERVRPDGTVDLDSALVAFSLAIAPLPGVTLPSEPPGLIDDGTEAIRWLKNHWSELTDAQRTEATKHLAPARAAAMDPGLIAAVIDPSIVSDTVVEATNPNPSRPVQATIDATREVIHKHLGRALGLEILWQVNAAEESVAGGRALAYATIIDDNGDAPNGVLSCLVVLNPSAIALDDVAFTATVAHEVFHCYQFEINQSLRDFDIPMVANPWVIEGQAEWAGETVAAELAGSASSLGTGWWRPYLLGPKKPLIARTYDAIGFYARLAERGQDPWLVFDQMLSAANGLEAFHYATDKVGDAFADSWASGYFRDIGSGRDWDITQGVARPAGMEPKPALIPLANGDSYRINVKAFANAIFVIDGPAEVVRFDVGGRTRLIDKWWYQVQGLDGGRDFCLKDPCVCPPKMHFKGEEPGFLTPQLKLAVSGSTDGALGSVMGVALKDLCEPDGTVHPRPCAKGCGVSNGDPHLGTVDGHAYDFMAAGEFTLLRSTDATVEVQARQEAYKDKQTVSINTAAAVRANGRRVVLSATPGGIELRIDGVVTSLTQPVDLGGGASVTAYKEGIQVKLPDETLVSLLSLGSYGVNVVVAPSDALRQTGAGLLAAIPRNARLPRLPDGSLLPAIGADRERSAQLYGPFSDAWRVTDATSLFDYAPGTSTASFTKPGFPDLEALSHVGELPLDAVPGAAEACGAITDRRLRDQCIFDVIVTNDLAFANQYVLAQRFQQGGTGALTGPGPAPSPSPQGLPAGVVELVPDLSILRGSALGPDGTLYLSVDTASGYEVLAVDPVAGKIVRRVPAQGAGQLAYSSGSLWVGEFTGDFHCSVTRLDPPTLAVLVTVPTTCGIGGTALAATADAVWIHDSTGIDVDGHGGHLRRIDPATNTLSGGIGIPFVFGSLRSSGSDVFYGDGAKGQFRIAAGGDRLEPIGAPEDGIVGGDTIWTQILTQQGNQALGYSGAGGPTRTLDIDGSLVGADGDAVYVGGHNGGSPVLVRYAVSGGAPTPVAQGATQQIGEELSPFGSFGSDEQDPLLSGDGGLVKLWTTRTPTPGPGRFALYLRWLPLP